MRDSQGSTFYRHGRSGILKDYANGAEAEAEKTDSRKGGKTTPRNSDCGGHRVGTGVSTGTFTLKRRVFLKR